MEGSDCHLLYQIYGVASGLSSLYWMPWLVWWVKEIIVSRSFHLFNWVVLTVLVLNVADDLIEAVYFTDAFQPRLQPVYFFVRAAKKSMTCGYLFPVVRGVVNLKSASSGDWGYMLGAMVGYFTIITAFGYLAPGSTVSTMCEYLFHLLAISLQIHFSSSTMESTERILPSFTSRKRFIISIRLRRLRWLLVALLIMFMQAVFCVLALMDIRSVFRRCKSVSMGYADVIVNKAVNSFVVMLVQPKETREEEETLMVN